MWKFYFHLWFIGNFEKVSNEWYWSMNFVKNSSLTEEILVETILKGNLSIRSKESRHKILRKECINLHINLLIESIYCSCRTFLTLRVISVENFERNFFLFNHKKKKEFFSCILILNSILKLIGNSALIKIRNIDNLLK